MYTGAALSFGLIRACRSGLVLCCSVLSDAGGENDGSSAIFERSLLAGRKPRISPAIMHFAHWPWQSITRARKAGCMCSILGGSELQTERHHGIDGNTLLSTVERIHQCWPLHSWKDLANHPTCDPKSFFMASHVYYSLCPSWPGIFWACTRRGTHQIFFSYLVNINGIWKWFENVRK